MQLKSMKSVKSNLENMNECAIATTPKNRSQWQHGISNGRFSILVLYRFHNICFL